MLAGGDIGLDSRSSLLMAYALMDRWMEHLANGHRIQLPGLGQIVPWIMPGFVNRDGVKTRTTRRLSFYPSARMRRLTAAILAEQLTTLGVDAYARPGAAPKYDSPAARRSTGDNRVPRP